MKTGKPTARPTLQVTQTEPLPVQLQQGLAVTATMHVRVATPSYPPYDYIWRVDPAYLTSPKEHSAQIAITGVPRPGRAPGKRDTLTTAHVAVIDIFGQVVEASAPVRFQRAAKRSQQVKQRRTSPLPQPALQPLPFHVAPAPPAYPVPRGNRRGTPRRTRRGTRRRSSSCVGRLGCLLLNLLLLLVIAGGAA